MKKIVVMCLVCSLLGFHSVSYAQKEELDQIVAVINEDVVTQSELSYALRMARVQINQERVEAPSDDQLRKQVLDQLINKKLQLQIAKLAGVNVTDADLTKMVERIAQQNNMSLAELYARLNSEGMSKTTYLREMHDQLTIQKLQQQEVVSRVNVTPEEISRFMRSQPWQTHAPKEYHLEDVVVPLSDEPSAQEIASAKKRAAEVVAALTQGKTLTDDAPANVTDVTSLQSNDLGWRKLPEIPSAFATQVVNMEPKQVATPIQTSNGFHVLRLAESRAIGDEQPKPTRKQVEELLLQRKFEQAVHTWVSKLRSQAFINTHPSTA